MATGKTAPPPKRADFDFGAGARPCLGRRERANERASERERGRAVGEWASAGTRGVSGAVHGARERVGALGASEADQLALAI